MNINLTKLFQAAVKYDQGDAKRIAHLLKVWGYAREIATLEHLEESEQELLEAAAILHDIGIHNAEKIHGSNAGKYQEIEGPAVAREILKDFAVSEDFIQRICYLISHHHHYTNVDGKDLQILLEADFLVNAYEDALSKTAIRAFREKVFKTKAGKWLLDTIYAV